MPQSKIIQKSDPNHSNILFGEYKLFVEMADRVSERRSKTNQFYISVLSALLAILVLVVEKNPIQNIDNIIYLLVALLGISLCFIWKINISSYRQLNTGKFKVIHELEKLMPFPMYQREWEFLGKGKDSKKYFQLTRVEKLVPMIIATPYILLLLFVIFNMIEL